jgi:hypothetical protein
MSKYMRKHTLASGSILELVMACRRPMMFAAAVASFEHDIHSTSIPDSNALVLLN